MSGPSIRQLEHAEGVTLLCYDSERRLVTCGGDGEVRTFVDVSQDEPFEDCINFELSTSKISAVACYLTREGSEGVAVAMDDNTVQGFSMDGSADRLLMRFTSPVTSLAVTRDHTLMAAGSSDFNIKVIDLRSTSSFSLVDHDAPVLCVTFDPKGELLASSSCDGSVRVWCMKERECLQTLSILAKASHETLAPSLAQLAWSPSGKLLAVPVGSEVKVYDRTNWKCSFTLSDQYHADEVLHVVRWSPCGDFLACGGACGRASIWTVATRTLQFKLKNDNSAGITGLDWDPRGRGSDFVVFADRDGYVGLFHDVYPAPSNQPPSEPATAIDDPFIEDSLLMEGIPADDIFNDDGFDDDIAQGARFGEDLDDINSLGEGVASGETRPSRPRGLLDSDDEGGNDGGVAGEGSLFSGRAPSLDPPLPPLRKEGPKFSEKLVEVYQEPWQPSATPTELQNRFMVYNLVGYVHSHDSQDTPLIEVDFHNSGTHHAFSLPNPLPYIMAALSEQALVLASSYMEDQPSQLHCVHFSSWDSHKDWTVPLSSKESITAVTIGNGWVAIATNKKMLRLFTVGGVQKELMSLPGHVTTLAAWGPRLCVVYQVPPCTRGVYSLTAWVLDVERRKQLHPPHILPLSRHAHLAWIGFSEGGCLVTHDSKGIVRILGNGCYGGLSWLPVLDTNKQLGSKDDNYFIVGMMHNPDELRGILCKGMSYPLVQQPRPVMSSLPLQIPLCEPQLERTELTRDYLQACLVWPPAEPHSSAERVQKLMKMFAYACKSGREFRAYEIAAMMPDQRSVDLAMTYASRSHHLRLARQISELSQQKFLDDLNSDLSGVDSDGDDEDAQEEEFQYAKERERTLKKESLVSSKGRRHGSNKEAWLQDAGSERSKISRIMQSVKQRKAGAARSHTHKKAPAMTRRDRSMSPESRPLSPIQADNTAELFSGSEDEERSQEVRSEGSAAESAGQVGSLERGSVERDGEEEEGGGAGDRSLRVFEDSQRKRPNPFKLTTPVSKRISAQRQTGFLDNITARVDQDARERDRKRAERDRKQEVGGGKGIKKKRQNPAPQAQRSLKKSFFKSKPDKTVPATSSNPASDSQSHDSTAGSCDGTTGSCDIAQDSNDSTSMSHDHQEGVANGDVPMMKNGVEPHEDETRNGIPDSVETSPAKGSKEKLSGTEKLASFAFKSA